ncbi:two-partner secretion domain-containing protein [Geminicoccus roseus]|uniref:two-partner secretion domain-containing protein n=1 Tax=Geminicoccus roseus TaxID=404900 RepID=UPI0009FC1312|nr:filamentous hemagglutinin N-terminal domain-containing protein [Geminicoccus roseus]
MWLRAILPLACAVFLLVPTTPPATAEVVLDGSVGSRGRLTLNGQDVRITPDMGTIRGSNLFHSFDKFGVPKGDAVTFEGPSGLDNVIGRVTGPDASQIHGTLRSTVPEAGLWLLNPNGLVVGKGAQIDVPASLHLSTADELRFEDGSVFSARDLPGSTLTAASPRAFGFLGGPIGKLAVEAPEINVVGGILSLTGGEITIDGSQIGVLGVVLIGAQASAGEISLIAPGAAARDGDVSISNGARIAAVLPLAGTTVRLEAGQLLLDRAQIESISFMDANDPAAEAIGLDLAAQTVVLIGDSGRAGGIVSTTLGSGKAPYLKIGATELTVDGASLGSSPGLGNGTAGDVTIQADRILLTRNAQVGTPALLASGSGAGGTTRITAGDSLTMTEGAAINSVTASNVDAGDVVLDVGTLTVTDGSIGTASFGSGGAAGSVTIRAKGEVIFSGQASILSLVLGDARGGDIRIDAAGLTLDQGAIIATSSAGSGTAGSVGVQAGTVSIGKGGRISADAGGSGDAGEIVIRANRDLSLDGGVISTGSAASSGGTVAIAAGQRVVIENGGEILTTILGGQDGEQAGSIVISGPGGSRTGTVTLDASSRIVANAPNVGDGGTIRILADGLIARPGQIDASARQGNAGTVASTAPQTNIVSSFAGLDAQVAPSDRLLATSCDARDVASSLIVGAVQTGGSGFDPDRPLGSEAAGPGCDP